MLIGQGIDSETSVEYIASVDDGIVRVLVKGNLGEGRDPFVREESWDAYYGAPFGPDISDIAKCEEVVEKFIQEYKNLVNGPV